MEWDYLHSSRKKRSPKFPLELCFKELEEAGGGGWGRVCVCEPLNENNLLNIVIFGG